MGAAKDRFLNVKRSDSREARVERMFWSGREDQSLLNSTIPALPDDQPHAEGVPPSGGGTKRA